MYCGTLVNLASSTQSWIFSSQCPFPGVYGEKPRPWGDHSHGSNQGSKRILKNTRKINWQKPVVITTAKKQLLDCTLNTKSLKSGLFGTTTSWDVSCEGWNQDCAKAWSATMSHFCIWIVWSSRVQSKYHSVGVPLLLYSVADSWAIPGRREWSITQIFQCGQENAQQQTYISIEVVFQTTTFFKLTFQSICFLVHPSQSRVWGLLEFHDLHVNLFSKVVLCLYILPNWSLRGMKISKACQHIFNRRLHA